MASPDISITSLLLCFLLLIIPLAISYRIKLVFPGNNRCGFRMTVQARYGRSVFDLCL